MSAFQAPDDGTRRNGTLECGAEQATAAMQALVEKWDRVTLRVDTKQYRYDRYNQLQAYVEPKRSPKTTFQQELLAQGWADVDAIGGLQREGRFDEARGEAELNDRGVWGQCAADFHAPLSPLPPATSGDAAGDRTIVVTSDGFERAGSWKPSRDGFELRSLARIWGPPTSYTECLATWNDLGISVGTTYTPGNCKRSSSRGQVKYVVADGPGWRTNRGLTIGDDAERLDLLYPAPFAEPFYNEEEGTTYVPLAGYFLGGRDGAPKDDLVAITDQDDLVTELGATLIFGAG